MADESAEGIEAQGTRLGIRDVEATVSVTFDGSENKIVRAAGDWTDSFAVGMLVFTDDNDNPGPYRITALTASDMTVEGVVTTDAEAASVDFEGYLEVGEVTNFDGPGGSATVIDRSHLTSTAREKLMGLPDEGQITFQLNFVPGNPGQVAFRKARKARSQQRFTLVFGNGTDAEPSDWMRLYGFAMEFSVSGAVDDKVNGNATIEVDGEVEWSDE